MILTAGGRSDSFNKNSTANIETNVKQKLQNVIFCALI